MDPGVQVRARSASFWCQAAPGKRGQDPFRGTQGRAPGGHRVPPKRGPPTEESGSDLFRSDGPNATAPSYRIESPQSVVQGCSAQGGAVGPGEKEF